MGNINEIILSLTSRCNLRCRMCDIPLNMASELSTAEWLKVINDAASCGVQSIVFSGGEPLLRHDLFELISFTKSKGLRTCLTSNGVFINEKVSNKLRQAGIDVVNISVEGPRRIHDYLRGKGTFEKVCRALINLKNSGVETTIATMVSRYNYRFMVFCMEIARQYGATTVKFQPFSRIFLEKRKEGKEFLISAHDIGNLHKIIEETVIFSGECAITTNPRSYLEILPFYLSGSMRTRKYGCAALESSCPVNPNGDIYPCWVITGSEELVGNVKESVFSDIWKSPRRLDVIARIERDGCPMCMMSCYDDNFGRDSLRFRVEMNFRRLKKKGVYNYVLVFVRRSIRRFRFYWSYRGSRKGIFRRLAGLFALKNKNTGSLAADRADAALEEIDLMKRVLGEEITDYNE